MYRLLVDVNRPTHDIEATDTRHHTTFRRRQTTLSRHGREFDLRHIASDFLTLRNRVGDGFHNFCRKRNRFPLFDLTSLVRAFIRNLLWVRQPTKQIEIYVNVDTIG